MREILKLVKSCCELADHKWLRSKVEEVLNSLNCCNQPESKSLSISIRLEKADLPQLGFGILLAICYCCVWAGRNGSLGWYGVLYTLHYFYVVFTSVHYTGSETGKVAVLAIYCSLCGLAPVAVTYIYYIYESYVLLIFILLISWQYGDCRQTYP